MRRDAVGAGRGGHGSGSLRRVGPGRVEAIDPAAVRGGGGRGGPGRPRERRCPAAAKAVPRREIPLRQAVPQPRHEPEPLRGLRRGVPAGVGVRRRTLPAAHPLRGRGRCPLRRRPRPAARPGGVHPGVGHRRRRALRGHRPVRRFVAARGGPGDRGGAAFPGPRRRILRGGRGGARGPPLPADLVERHLLRLRPEDVRGRRVVRLRRPGMGAGRRRRPPGDERRLGRARVPRPGHVRRGRPGGGA